MPVDNDFFGKGPVPLPNIPDYSNYGNVSGKGAYMNPGMTGGIFRPSKYGPECAANPHESQEPALLAYPVKIEGRVTSWGGMAGLGGEDELQMKYIRRKGIISHEKYFKDRLPKVPGYKCTTHAEPYDNALHYEYTPESDNERRWKEKIDEAKMEEERAKSIYERGDFQLAAEVDKHIMDTKKLEFELELAKSKMSIEVEIMKARIAGGPTPYRDNQRKSPLQRLRNEIDDWCKNIFSEN